MKPDLRGLVVKKFNDCGFSYSDLARTIGCDRKSLYMWEAAMPADGWAPEWDAYYRDRTGLNSLAIDSGHDFQSALNQLGKELLAAMRRDPVRFLNECGQLLERLNQPSAGGFPTPQRNGATTEDWMTSYGR